MHKKRFLTWIFLWDSNSQWQFWGSQASVSRAESEWAVQIGVGSLPNMIERHFQVVGTFLETPGAVDFFNTQAEILAAILKQEWTRWNKEAQLLDGQL